MAIESDEWASYKPALRAEHPAGWFVKESVTLMSPDGLANVIFSSEPVPAELDTAQYVDVQSELLRTEFPQYEEIALEEMTLFGGRSGWLRRFRWVPSDGEPVTQLQLYYVENGRGYTSTATSPTSEFADHEHELIRIVRQLTIVAKSDACDPSREVTAPSP